MGCAVSMPKVGTTSPCLGKNAGATSVVDGVRLVLPAEQVMPVKKMDSAEDEVERDDNIQFPRSPSFNVFFTNDNIQGYDDEKAEKGKQECDAENNDNKGQGSSDGTRKRGTTRKELKSVKQKFKVF
ncbi:hypothetical protein V6N13_028169 [Hibiscus sabdariffa]|uniref:Uncharacterized protein n=2 Tax=Hibiscus sabdariffa TaxID=183260 RepID=A0ABR2DB89_9ROSI